MRLGLGEFSQFVEGSTEEVYLVRADGRITWANDAAVQSLGYPRERLLELSLRDLAPSSAAGLPERFARAREAHLPPFRTTHLTSDGSPVEKEIRALYVEVEGEGYLCSFGRDVRDHRRIEAELRQLARLYAVLSQVNSAVVRIKTPQALYEAVCRVATEQGRFRMAWVGLRDERDFVQPVAQAGHVAGYLDSVTISVGDDSMARGPTGTAVRTGRLDICSDIATEPRMTPWRAKAMARGYLASAAVPLQVEGKVIGALMLYAPEPDFFTAQECALLQQIGDDLSFALAAMAGAQARERLERELEQSHRLEAVGRLAGGVAHDFNNLLTIILSGAEEATTLLPAGAAALEPLQEIRDAAVRSGQLTRQLLGVARRHPSTPREVRLNDAIDAALPMLRRLAGPGVEVRFERGESPPVQLDPTHLDQLLTNLVANARDAIDGAGVVRLVTGRRELEAAEASRRAIAGSTCARLIISDDGSGMPPDVLERVFEPFFTTKPAGKGTGLGLATVYGLVRQAGGNIEATSSRGEGSTFTILLPAGAG